MELNPQASEIYRSFLAGAMVIALGYLSYRALLTMRWVLPYLQH